MLDMRFVRTKHLQQVLQVSAGDVRRSVVEPRKHILSPVVLQTHQSLNFDLPRHRLVRNVLDGSQDDTGARPRSGTNAGLLFHRVAGGIEVDLGGGDGGGGGAYGRDVIDDVIEVRLDATLLAQSISRLSTGVRVRPVHFRRVYEGR